MLGSLIAAAMAIRFRPMELGPDEIDEPPQAVIAVAHGLADGVRAVAAVPTVAAAFGALAAHRLAFGISTLLTLLLFRYAFIDEGLLRGGIVGIGEAIVIAAVGLAVAAVVTPLLVRWLGRATTVRIGLVVGVVASLWLAASITLPAVLIAAFVLPTTGQVIKLCADAAVQSEIGDEVRGRVFALYDAVFNVCYVLAVTAAALLSPPDGDSSLLLVIAAGVYVLGLAVHEWQLRRAAQVDTPARGAPSGNRAGKTRP
jgi:MFS family permease